MILDAHGKPIVRDQRGERIEVSKASYPLRKFTWTVTYGDERGWRIPLLPLVVVAGLYDRSSDKPRAPTLREQLR